MNQDDYIDPIPGIREKYVLCKLELSIDKNVYDIKPGTYVQYGAFLFAPYLKKTLAYEYVTARSERRTKFLTGETVLVDSLQIEDLIRTMQIMRSICTRHTPYCPESPQWYYTLKNFCIGPFRPYAPAPNKDIHPEVPCFIQDKLLESIADNELLSTKINVMISLDKDSKSKYSSKIKGLSNTCINVSFPSAFTVSLTFQIMGVCLDQE